MDGCIIMAAHAKCSLREHLAVFDVRLRAFLVEDIQQDTIFSLARNDYHVLEVLGSRTYQRDTAYIYLLDNILF